ncbi:MAG: hypothetical protein L0H63_09675 [Nitrococcus sp.]|nr:hypothetical protein [Nitrococcus sp.]
MVNIDPSALDRLRARIGNESVAWHVILRLRLCALQQQLHDQGAELPVIFLSYLGNVAAAVTVLKCGAADFSENPFNDQTRLTTARG